VFQKSVADLSAVVRREEFMASVISEPNQPELNRRSVLGVAAGVAVTAAASAVPQPVSAGTHPSDIVLMDATTLAATIRSRQASCVDVMTDYLDHIEKLNPKVNAIVALQDRTALLAQSRERDAQLARGELMGRSTAFHMLSRIWCPSKASQ
jgi:hypothetical protein